MSTQKHGKCSNCLPDGGAILTASYRGESMVWECNNCGNTSARRQNKPTPKITPSQQRVIDRLVKAGWTLETSFIGRGVWVSGRKERGNGTMNLIAGDSFYGNVGPGGAFKFTLQRMGKCPIITDEIGISVYLD